MRCSFRRSFALVAAVPVFAAAACSSGGHGRNTGLPSAPRPLPSSATPFTPASAPKSSPASGSVITRYAFGMHVLGWGRLPYPVVPFATARVWDMGVTWTDLLPDRASRLSSPNPVVARLDSIVDGFHRHGVAPMITLGMTPAWAARPCHHDIRGVDWGAKTCAPRDTSA